MSRASEPACFTDTHNGTITGVPRSVRLSLLIVVLVASLVALVFVRARRQSAASVPHIRAAAPFSTPEAAAASAAAPQRWLEYHADDSHTGAVGRSLLLPARAGWISPVLDGDVYGEPLAADGTVIAATTNDTVYGLDPASGAVRWSTHLATPVRLSTLPCGNVDPLGILSTPVIDASLHRVLVVAEERAGRVISHELVGLDTRTGAVQTRQVVDPAGMNVRYQQQRSSLILDRGRVVVAFGGLLGDCGQYHGWLVSASEEGTGPLQTFHAPGNEVAMWSAGGPVVDGAGNIYVATGNGSSSTTTYDLGNSVLKLSPSLQLLDSFAVSEWAADNAADEDLGSAGPVLLDGHLLFEAGKRHTGYLLDTGHLGGIGGQRFAGPTGCASFGGEAWAPPSLYVACSGGPLRAFKVDTVAATFTLEWQSTGPGDGPPVVAGGAVWSEDWTGGTLYAFDPETGHTLASFPTGRADNFVTPSVVGDLVVVGVGHQLRAFAGPA